MSAELPFRPTDEPQKVAAAAYATGCAVAHKIAENPAAYPDDYIAAIKAEWMEYGEYVGKGVSFTIRTIQNSKESP